MGMMTRQNAADGGDHNSGIHVILGSYTSSLPVHAASLQKQPVASGVSIAISGRKLLENLEVSRAQRIRSWVDWLKASSPTHVKSPYSPTNDDNSSCRMTKDELGKPEQHGTDRTHWPSMLSSSAASAPTPTPQATNGFTTSPPPPAITLPSKGDNPSTNSTTQAINSASPPPPPPLALPLAALNMGSPPGTLEELIVGIAIGVLLVVVGVCIFVTIHRRRERRLELGGYYPQGPTDTDSGRPSPLPSPAPSPGPSLVPSPAPSLVPSPAPSPGPSSVLSRGMALGRSHSQFAYEELEIATDGFSNHNLLGQGGFGYVHRGVLSSGKVVAVKQLKAGSGQGEREFQAEVQIISRIHHRHLVSLVGYCISGAHRILVYEFVPNNTLEFHLHGKDRPTMGWPTRMKIALGSARGLAYLHEECNPRIIHRDIKASNILLESNFEAKVADFGLARFAPDTDSHVYTGVAGTLGYMAPDYASSGKLTEKSDIFSFGVLLLELITGRRPINNTLPSSERSLFYWATPLLPPALGDGKFDAIVDPKLQKDYDSEEMTRMIACAADCIHHSAQHRPQITQVVRALEGNLFLRDLNGGIMSGHTEASSPCGRPGYDTSQCQVGSNKSKMMAVEGQEQATSKFKCPSGEYGLQLSIASSRGQQTTQEMDLGKMAAHGHHSSGGP